MLRLHSEVAGFRETLECLPFVLDFAVFVLDVLPQTIQSFTFGPCSFLLKSSLKTKLLVFLACFSNPTKCFAHDVCGVAVKSCVCVFFACRLHS